jgi:hypothetical protein
MANYGVALELFRALSVLVSGDWSLRLLTRLILDLTERRRRDFYSCSLLGI